MAQVQPEIETFARIKVIGVGGGGGSAANRMVEAGIKGVEFIALNTDVQALHHSLAAQKLAIGKSVTRGLGAGMNPDIGYRAAEESQNEIRNLINGADMVFITCGLGGGTGSGAAHHVAKLARDVGALTVAVVTKPFTFEGAQRKRIADEAYEQLSKNVDTIITIPNDRVLQIIDKKTSLVDAFNIVDDVLRQGVQGISELITVPGLINVDFADVKAIMQNSGSALMGIGRASGENRAVDAAKQAIASPLLELSIEGAKGILFTITGSGDLGMHEVAEAAKVITGSADDDARVIFGANINENMEDEIVITVVATGFEGSEHASTVYGTSAVPVAATWAPPVTRVQTVSEPASLPDFMNTSSVHDRSDEDKMSSAMSRRLPAEEPQQQRQTPQQAPAHEQVQNQPVEEDRDSIDIPAFIRKKMM